MISSWETVAHKSLIKINDILDQELGKLDKEALLNKGILSGPLIITEEMRKLLEVLGISVEAKKDNAPSIEVPTLIRE